MQKNSPSTIKKARNYFKASKQSDETYRVEYRKRGVMMIDSICTEQEVERHRIEYKKKLVFNVPEEHIPQPAKIKQRAIDVVNYFYKKILQPNDYYVLNGLNVKLFNGDDDAQLWIPINNKEFVTEINLVKFYLNRKKLDLSEQKSLLYFNHKKVKGGYYLIGAMPKLNFYNNRIGYYVPRLGTQITQSNAKRLWSKIETEFAYDEVKIAIKDIPTNDKRKKNGLTTLTQRNEKLKRTERIEFRKIMRMDCAELTPGMAENLLKAKIKNSKWYKTQNKLGAIENRQSYVLDKSFRKKQREKELKSLLAR